MFKIEEEKLKKREVLEIWTYFSFFENIIGDINLLVSAKKNKDFIKRIDSVDLELLLNGINQSVSRINDTIGALNSSKYEWKRDVTINVIKKSLRKCENLFNNILKAYIENDNIHHIEEEFTKKKDEIISSLE